MSKRTAVIIGIAATTLLAGCGSVPAPAATPSEAVIHFANRSDTALAVAPDFLIPACGSASATPAAYAASRTQGAKVMMDGTWTVPPGAAFWNGPAFAGDPIQDDLTVVISSTADPAVRAGVVAEADLPACGGAPMGVLDEVVPDGGPVDNGQEPVRTLLPRRQP